MSVSRETALRFERLRIEHIGPLLDIDAEAYPDPWTFGMFQQEITNRSSHFFVAFAEDSVAGYGGFWLVADEAHITKVTVVAPLRGLGYGREIMAHLLEMGATLGATVARLEVRESNSRARTLYERLGFEATGVRHGYYARCPEAALVMTRNLAGKAELETGLTE
ncbi:MAG TPA: ribosomal protein S18-alanine N-acetyltransferase [Candidatus Hydrogenedentes bacterium]|nr:ribosomal protein S18-alanine N-acetyltransferase [Candidatus Hydrogenedentota bacterium]HNT87554.1 ribosomal protein S18-alanine N-acetyltransferase [Candidatus Hydrogenedentota bacterium]